MWNGVGGEPCMKERSIMEDFGIMSNLVGMELELVWVVVEGFAAQKVATTEVA
jgi:hypothetical protein